MADYKVIDRKNIENRSLKSVSSLGDNLLAFEVWFFTKKQIRFYAFGTLFAYFMGLTTRLLTNTWIFEADGKPSCIDFSFFWVSGALAGSGDPTLVYNVSAFAAARANLGGARDCIVMNYFAYPPTSLFFTYPLGLMPYVAAFAAWTAVTLLLYLVAIYLIVPRPVAILVAFSPFPVFFNIFLGQNGFLLAGLMGLSLVLMERHPRLSGIFLGLLTFKPQMGILFPFALLISRKWRVILSAIATSVVLVVTSVVVFGYQAWPSFIHALANRGQNLSPISQISIRLDSLYGFLWLSGINAPTAWAVQLAVAGSAAVIVGWLWAGRFPHALKAAALCSAAGMVTPYLHGQRSMRPGDSGRLFGQGRV